MNSNLEIKNVSYKNCIMKFNHLTNIKGTQQVSVQHFISFYILSYYLQFFSVNVPFTEYTELIEHGTVTRCKFCNKSVQKMSSLIDIKMEL